MPTRLHKPTPADNSRGGRPSNFNVPRLGFDVRWKLFNLGNSTVSEPPFKLWSGWSRPIVAEIIAEMLLTAIILVVLRSVGADQIVAGAEGEESATWQAADS